MEFFISHLLGKGNKYEYLYELPRMNFNMPHHPLNIFYEFKNCLELLFDNISPKMYIMFLILT